MGNSSSQPCHWLRSRSTRKCSHSAPAGWACKSGLRAWAESAPRWPSGRPGRSWRCRRHPASTGPAVPRPRAGLVVERNDGGPGRWAQRRRPARLPPAGPQHPPQGCRPPCNASHTLAALFFGNCHELEVRHCRPAQRREIHLVQRVDQGWHRRRELPVLHHRAQCGHRGTARPAAGPAGGHHQARAHRAGDRGIRGHCGPGGRRQQGRRPGQPVSGAHPRDRRHRQRGALL
jgi:hypothetical protein